MRLRLTQTKFGVSNETPYTNAHFRGSAKYNAGNNTRGKEKKKMIVYIFLYVVASSCHVSYERGRARETGNDRKTKKKKQHTLYRNLPGQWVRRRQVPEDVLRVLARRTPTATTAVYNIHILIFRAYVLGTRVPHSWLLEGTTVSSAVERKHPAKAPCCIGAGDGCARRFVYYALTRCRVRTDTCCARAHSTPFHLFRVVLFTQFYTHFFALTTFNVGSRGFFVPRNHQHRFRSHFPTNRRRDVLKYLRDPIENDRFWKKKKTKMHFLFRFLSLIPFEVGLRCRIGRVFLREAIIFCFIYVLKMLALKTVACHTRARCEQMPWTLDLEEGGIVIRRLKKKLNK